MCITSKQVQNLQAEACRMAEELPKRELLDGLIATYEAGRLLHMSKSALVCHFACDTAHRIDDQGAPRLCGQGAPGGEVG